MKSAEFSFSQSKQESDPKYPTNNEAFNFLGQCAGAQFDWTSAEPPHPTKSGIFPPKKILTLIRSDNLDFDSFTEVSGTSRGEEQTLQECVNFFQRNGINANKDNVSLNDNILSALEKTYEILGLSQERKILVLTPTFGYYFKQFKDRNIGFETLATKAEDGFLPNSKDLKESIIKTGALALLLCYPNNPTGAVMTKECASEIAEIIVEHHVFVISDEAFLNNSLSEKTHFPIAAIDKIMNRSLTITSTAKSMFIGSKTGFCVGDLQIVTNFEKLGGYSNKHTQKIMAAGLENSEENQEYLAKCRQYYLKNIETVKINSVQLNEIFCQQFGEEKTFVKPFVENPDATNVYLLDFSGLCGKKHNEKILNTGLDIAKWMFEECSIATVPGECFLFDEKQMLVRIALKQPQQEIEAAFEKMFVTAKKIKNSSKSPSPNTSEKLDNSTKKTSSQANYT